MRASAACGRRRRERVEAERRGDLCCHSTKIQQRDSHVRHVKSAAAHHGCQVTTTGCAQASPAIAGKDQIPSAQSQRSLETAKNRRRQAPRAQGSPFDRPAGRMSVCGVRRGASKRSSPAPPPADTGSPSRDLLSAPGARIRTLRCPPARAHRSRPPPAPWVGARQPAAGALSTHPPARAPARSAARPPPSAGAPPRPRRPRRRRPRARAVASQTLRTSSSSPKQRCVTLLRRPTVCGPQPAPRRALLAMPCCVLAVGPISHSPPRKPQRLRAWGSANTIDETTIPPLAPVSAQGAASASARTGGTAARPPADTASPASSRPAPFFPPLVPPPFLRPPATTPLPPPPIPLTPTRLVRPVSARAAPSSRRPPATCPSCTAHLTRSAPRP